MKALSSKGSGTMKSRSGTMRSSKFDFRKVSNSQAKNSMDLIIKSDKNLLKDLYDSFDS